MKRAVMIWMIVSGCQTATDSSQSVSSMKQLDYTFDNGWGETFSIKIEPDGRCVVGEGRWTIKYYSGKLNPESILNLDTLIRHADLKKYDSSYTEDKVDQHTYKIVLVGENSDTTKRFVYGNNAPKQLSEFSDKIISLKRRLQLSPKDTMVNFISRNGFFPPPIEAPILKK